MSENETDTQANSKAQSFLIGLMGDGLDQEPEDRIEVDTGDYETTKASQLELLRPNRITPDLVKQYVRDNTISFVPAPEVPGVNASALFAYANRNTSTATQNVEPSMVASAQGDEAPSDNTAQDPDEGAAIADKIMSDLQGQNSEPDSSGMPSGPEPSQMAGGANPKVSSMIGDSISNAIGGTVGGLISGLGTTVTETLKQTGNILGATGEHGGKAISSTLKGGYDAAQDVRDHISSKRGERTKQQLNDDGEVDSPEYDDVAQSIMAKMEARNKLNPGDMANQRVSSILQENQSMVDGQLKEVARILEIPEDQIGDPDAIMAALEKAHPATKEQIQELESGYVNDLKAREESLISTLQDDPEFQALSEEEQAQYVESLMANLDASKSLTEEQNKFLAALNENGLLTNMGGFLKDMFNNAKEALSGMLERLGMKGDMSDEVKAATDQGAAPGSK